MCRREGCARARKTAFVSANRACAVLVGLDPFDMRKLHGRPAPSLGAMFTHGLPNRHDFRELVGGVDRGLIPSSEYLHVERLLTLVFSAEDKRGILGREIVLP